MSELARRLGALGWLVDGARRDMDGLLGSEDCVKADSGLLAAAHAAAGIVAAVTGGAAAIADLKHNLVAPRRVAAMHDACAVLSAAAYESCNREPNGVTGQSKRGIRPEEVTEDKWCMQPHLTM